MIYFVLNPLTDMAKIGFTSNHPAGRIRKLETGAGTRLEFLAGMPGDRKFEQELHRQFAALRHFQEWFRMEEPLCGFIKRVKVDHPKLSLKVSAKKPAKPNLYFPLFAHDSGQWAKKVDQRTRYFGPWGDPEAALLRYQDFVIERIWPSQHAREKLHP